MRSGFSRANCGSHDAVFASGRPRRDELWSAMFTERVSRVPHRCWSQLLAAGSRLRGICVNNKINYVFPGGARRKGGCGCCLAALPGSALPTATDVAVLPSSTGIIGWRIPVDEMVDEVPALVKSLQSESILPVARGIMTTDLYPKVRSVEIPCADGSTGRLVGIAKGAGMIEPNMATMLVFFLTDSIAPRAATWPRLYCRSQQELSHFN